MMNALWIQAVLAVCNRCIVADEMHMGWAHIYNLILKSNDGFMCFRSMDRRQRVLRNHQEGQSFIQEYNEDSKFYKKIPREDDVKRSTLGIKNMPTDGLGGTKSVEGTVKVVIY